MKTIIQFSLIALLAAGCSKAVPPVDDPNNIVVDGKPMTQQAYLETYCADQTQNDTCIKVRRAMVAGATRSKTGPARF